MFNAKIFKDGELFFDEAFRHAEDYELWSRIQLDFKLYNIQETLYKMRKHDNNVSRKYSDIQLANINLIKQKVFNSLQVYPNNEQIEAYTKFAYSDFNLSLGEVHCLIPLLNNLIKSDQEVLPKKFMREKIHHLWSHFVVNSNLSIAELITCNKKVDVLSKRSRIVLSLKLLLKKLL
jgi:hypothetical protein